MQPQDLWQVFNLRDTPYFQEALRPGDGARYPVEWFVGRDTEAERLARTIMGHAGSSRQSIRGSAGVGKSTLAQVDGPPCYIGSAVRPCWHLLTAKVD